MREIISRLDDIFLMVVSISLHYYFVLFVSLSLSLSFFFPLSLSCPTFLLSFRQSQYFLKISVFLPSLQSLFFSLSLSSYFPLRDSCSPLHFPLTLTALPQNAFAVKTRFADDAQPPHGFDPHTISVCEYCNIIRCDDTLLATRVYPSNSASRNRECFAGYRWSHCFGVIAIF